MLTELFYVALLIIILVVTLRENPIDDFLRFAMFCQMVKHKLATQWKPIRTADMNTPAKRTKLMQMFSDL